VVYAGMLDCFRQILSTEGAIRPERALAATLWWASSLPVISATLLCRCAMDSRLGDLSRGCRTTQ